MLNLVGLTQEELKSEITKLGDKPFRAKQIWEAIYLKDVRHLDDLHNIPKDLREKLKEGYSISAPKVIEDIISQDGTRKWLINFDGQEIEMVFIPEENRGTLCISSQVGCTLTCTFCHTGTQRLVRNLTAGEIVWQFLLARDLVEDKSDISNIVFMGMGEPLFNYENVKKAIHILNHDKGLNFSKRRIVVSTSGVVPELIKFCDEINTGLAISLHASNDELRSKIMPINKKYPLKELLDACRYYDKNNSQKVTFEYVMLKDVNDSEDDAFALARLLKSKKIHSKVNLIPFNSWKGSEYECSSRNRIMAFSRILQNQNIEAPIRKTRGEDVMAACGQLKSLSKSEKLIK
jgi:23S rRNA (adenine2503-C2)-methyltransferase